MECFSIEGGCGVSYQSIYKKARLQRITVKTTLYYFIYCRSVIKIVSYDQCCMKKKLNAQSILNEIFSTVKTANNYLNYVAKWMTNSDIHNCISSSLVDRDEAIDYRGAQWQSRSTVALYFSTTEACLKAD